jgi:phosphoglycerate kinase
VFPFLRAKGFAVGNSKTDAGSIESAKIILKMKEAEKLVFPEDFKAAEQFSARAKSKIIAFNEFGTREMGLDLGPETVKKYKAYLRGARTIFWNGPLGYFEWPQFAEATREIAREMARLNAITICGGGETAEAVKKMKLEHRMTHVSLGGGATIAYLSGEEMPGLKALKENRNKFKP